MCKNEVFIILPKESIINTKEGRIMFRIKKTEYTNKTFRLPTDLVKKMEALAQNKQVSLNNLVVQCCEYALDNIDQEAPNGESKK